MHRKIFAADLWVYENCVPERPTQPAYVHMHALQRQGATSHESILWHAHVRLEGFVCCMLSIICLSLELCVGMFPFYNPQRIDVWEFKAHRTVSQSAYGSHCI